MKYIISAAALVTVVAGNACCPPMKVYDATLDLVSTLNRRRLYPDADCLDQRASLVPWVANGEDYLWEKRSGTETEFTRCPFDLLAIQGDYWNMEAGGVAPTSQRVVALNVGSTQGIFENTWFVNPSAASGDNTPCQTGIDWVGADLVTATSAGGVFIIRAASSVMSSWTTFVTSSFYALCPSGCDIRVVTATADVYTDVMTALSIKSCTPCDVSTSTSSATPAPVVGGVTVVAVDTTTSGGFAVGPNVISVTIAILALVGIFV